MLLLSVNVGRVIAGTGRARNRSYFDSWDSDWTLMLLLIASEVQLSCSAPFGGVNVSSLVTLL